MHKIKRAIISVSDKTGIVDFARELAEAGVEILSTGGTAKTLREANVPVKEVSDYTGFPEMFDGRVKTLHPKIHGGILYKRNSEDHVSDAAIHGVEPIDMVVVNLYPFEETIRKPGVTSDEAIENIDIGGPAMLRSASKNYQDVLAIVDPGDYNWILEMLDEYGDVPIDSRMELARKVFRHISRYDGLIAGYFGALLYRETEV